MNFYNQREHELLDRSLVIPFLRSLEKCELEPTSTPSQDDKLNELLKTCGSRFEKQVLHMTVDQHLPLPDFGQKTIFDHDRPVAKLDFYYAQKNIVVFVDGPPCDQDYVQKGDEQKRKELKDLGHRVFSISYNSVDQDLRKLGSALLT
ncbi:MAG: hypothetical protein JRN15_09680 [Nitrososphaerota archaeon]|nr:hypothetical protein [Nitrososphaerota archaeon]